jgi:hypothetical protein
MALMTIHLVGLGEVPRLLIEGGSAANKGRLTGELKLFI